MLSQSVILTENNLRDAVDYFSRQSWFTFDVESSGENRGVPHLNSLSWLSMATKGAVIVIPFGHPIGNKIIGQTDEVIKWGKGTRTVHHPVYEPAPKQLDRATVFDIIRPVFFREDIAKVNSGIAFDIASTAKYFGEVAPGPYFCTVTEQWLLRETFAQDKGLKALVKERYEFEYDNEDVGKSVESYPFDLVAYYSYCDALFPWFLHRDFLPQIEAQGLRPVLDLEMDVLNVVVGMKLAGARVDIPRLMELREDLQSRKAQTEDRIYHAAGHAFNLNSPPQKQKVLFDEQGLDAWKKTAKGGRSVDDDVLQSHSGNPVVSALIEFGDIDKLLGTYVDPWLNGWTYDGRIHADFVPYGTVTGRFSCRKPNLQNIPRPGTELGTLIRGAFIPEDGYRLVVADYSQIELVILAHYLGTGALYEGFLKGIDPHRIHAAGVLHKAPEEVTKQERQDLGKTLGFAICYGAGPKKVASMAHVTEDEAKQILGEYDRTFPEVREFQKLTLRKAREHNPPVIRTLLGRKRRLPELNYRDYKVKSRAERQAFNALIQGGAADLIKTAMVRADNLIPEGVDLILTVHDEIVLEAPADLAEKSAEILNFAMTGPEIQELIRVPLKAEVNIVDRWSDAK